MKIIHIITGLSTGGAEMMLFKLLSQINSNVIESEVISLTDKGPVAEKIRALGVPVYALGMKRGRPHPVAFFRLIRLLRRKKPDIVQTWLYHSDLIGGLAATFAGGIKTFWSIRQSNIETDSNKRTTMWIAGICAKLSYRLPYKIICCSHAALETHADLGYDRGKMLVIPNGFDLETFRPDMGARSSVLNELGIDKDTCLIGLVGRFDPQKDHHNFIMAAGLIRNTHPQVHFILCGEGIGSENRVLMNWIVQAELGKSIHLLGIRSDISRILASVDIAVSSSLGEGFPNVVGEAMACAAANVVTDVGDSALLVGDAGRVVPARNSQALAAAVIELLQLSSPIRKQLGTRARQRIMDNYSLDAVVKMYEKVYLEADT